MKRLITILILLVLVGHSTRLYSWKPVEVSSYEMNEKKDMGSKEDKKHVEVYVFNIYPCAINPLSTASFTGLPQVCIKSPIIDHRTPPPDNYFVV